MTASNQNIFYVTGHQRGELALVSSLICAWINGWIHNREAGDLRRYRAHYDLTVMRTSEISISDHVDCKQISNAYRAWYQILVPQIQNVSMQFNSSVVVVWASICDNLLIEIWATTEWNHSRVGLTAPGHYLNQCYLIINDVLWHSPDGNFTGNYQDIYGSLKRQLS